MFTPFFKKNEKAIGISIYFSLLALVFLMAHCTLQVRHLTFSASALFGGLYLFVGHYLFKKYPKDFPQLPILNVSVGLLLLGLTKGLHFLTYAPSTMVPLTLWEGPLPNQFLLYFVLLLIRTSSSYASSPLAFKKNNRIHFLLLQSRIFDVTMILLVLISRFLFDQPPFALVNFVISWGVYIIFFLLARWVNYFLTKGKVAQSEMPTEEASPVGYTFFLLFFVGVCILTNLLIVKHIKVYTLVFTAGVCTYPLTFLCMDIVTEQYGKAKAKTLIWGGLVSNCILFLAISLVGMLPFVEGESKKLLFYETFSFVSLSLVASMAAYLVGQWVSLYLFSYLRLRTGGKHLWLRNNTATILSQGLDTFLFATLAWGLYWAFPSTSTTPLSKSVWIAIAMNEYGIKILLALLDTPILYLVLYLLRHGRRLTTRFTPNGRKRQS